MENANLVAHQEIRWKRLEESFLVTLETLKRFFSLFRTHLNALFRDGFSFA